MPIHQPVSFWKLGPDHVPIPADDGEASALFREDRHVAWDEVAGAKVSTVFLVIDHGFEGPPVLFETMVFNGPHDQWQDRYQTWDEALAGHNRVVEALREGSDP